MARKIRVYTLTFQFCRNFGALMQAYALQSYLETQNCDVGVIDYWPRYAVEHYKKPFIKSKKITAKNLALALHFWLSQSKANTFRKKHIHLTKKCFSKKQVEDLPAADVIFVGSDQVWNHELLGEYNEIYFLQINTNSIKATYAASAGQDNLTTKEIRKLVEYANQFDFISVRERSLFHLLSENGCDKVQSVLDPVFLLNRIEYHKLSKPSIKGEYILTYYTDADGLTDEMAKRISYENGGTPVYKIGRYKTKNGIIGLPNQSIEQIVGLIENAKYIITSSFHVTAFSIIFRKNFYTVCAGNRSSRLTSILNLTGLDERYIANKEMLATINISEIDYSKIDGRIEKEIINSKEYIQQVIKTITNGEGNDEIRN